MALLKIKNLISPLLLAIFMRTLRQRIEDLIEHISCLTTVFESTSSMRKYLFAVFTTSFIFETIIELSDAIRNVNAQLVLMNRGLTYTYKMLIWMLLWDPLTYLFHWGTRVLVLSYYLLCDKLRRLLFAELIKCNTKHYATSTTCYR